MSILDIEGNIILEGFALQDSDMDIYEVEYKKKKLVCFRFNTPKKKDLEIYELNQITILEAGFKIIGLAKDYRKEIYTITERDLFKGIDYAYKKLIYKRNTTQTSHQRAREFKESLIEDATPSELKFRRILELENISHSFQHVYVYSWKHYILDFLVGDIVFEIDGGYHNTEEQKLKDKERDYRLSVGGLKVVRIQNKQAEDPEYVKWLLIELGILELHPSLKFNKSK